MPGELTRITNELSGLFSERARFSVERILAMDPPAVWELRLTPPEKILRPAEIAALRECDERSAPVAGAVPRQLVVIVKATRLCNLRCTYCNSWREGPGQVMPFPVLAALTRDVVTNPTVANVDFVWHGGEVTLLSPEYLRKAIWLQEYYRRPEIEIANSIQTNATKLNDRWIQLLRELRISVGVSIDGPPEVHDLRRVHADGAGSWKDVKRGIDLLRENEIPFGALAVVDECVIRLGAEAYLGYLVDLGVQQVALLNALPPNTEACQGNAAYLPHQRFTEFLRDLFRAWWNGFRQSIEIRELQALVDAVTRGATGLCIFSRQNCMGQYLTVEPEGGVSACDKYVGIPEYEFGDIRGLELSRMLLQSKRLEQAKADVAAKKKRLEGCPHYRVCFGGCPHDIRLSERYQQSWTSECCGMSALIEDISLSVTDTLSAI